MKNTPIVSLQSAPDCCKLQSACKLESSKNNHLEQFADCRLQSPDCRDPLQSTHKPSNDGACRCNSRLHADSLSLRERRAPKGGSPSRGGGFGKHDRSSDALFGSRDHQRLGYPDCTRTRHQRFCQFQKRSLARRWYALCEVHSVFERVESICWPNPSGLFRGGSSPFGRRCGPRLRWLHGTPDGLV